MDEQIKKLDEMENRLEKKKKKFEPTELEN